MTFDVAIVGAGPAGSTCAAVCAAAGLRTLLLERAIFPREKVCGDCVNPGCWPVLERLEIAERIRAFPHSRLAHVEFVDAGGRSLRFPLAPSPGGEIAIKRSLLDAELLQRARELGAEVLQNTGVTAIERGWKIHAGSLTFEARLLVAADGRNSTVARLLGLLPAAEKDRVGLQTHLAAPREFGEKVAMHFLPHGYCGVASVGDSQVNLCLVSHPKHLNSLRRWAGEQFQISPDNAWRSITPLARRPISPAYDNLLLVGDAARVVEPFTGEGIYYALRSGALAADHIIAGNLVSYAVAHAALYRGRLWVNELAKAAVLHPRLAVAALAVAQRWPSALRLLTAKVLGGAALN